MPARHTRTLKTDNLSNIDIITCIQSQQKLFLAYSFSAHTAVLCLSVSREALLSLRSLLGLPSSDSFSCFFVVLEKAKK